VAHGKSVEECPGTFGRLEENKRILVNKSEEFSHGLCHLLWVPLWEDQMKGHVGDACLFFFLF
jgi:hypothetical protein